MTLPVGCFFAPRSFLHLGILYIASSLRKAGHDVKVFDCHALTEWDAKNQKLIIHKEKLEECDVVGISATTANCEWGKMLAKAWPAKYKVLGGTHATYILDGPHERFKKPHYFENFDYIMTQECEESFVSFCDAVDKGIEPRNKLLPAIPSLHWFFGDKHCQTEKGPQPDVTKLPIPAFDLWPGGFGGGGLSVVSNTAGVINLNEAMTASLFNVRGCPFGCNFCADRRTKIREETYEQVEAQCKMLAELGVTCIRIQDDVLTIKAAHCRRVSDILHSYGMKWRGNTRVNLTDPTLFKYMEQHGCIELGFGCEHGSDMMLKLMGKGTVAAKNTEGIKMCQEAGMVAKAFLMIGFPGETWETVREMERWVLAAKPNMVAVCLFQPFPGSDVWNHPENYGVTLPENAFDRFWQQGLDDDPRALVLDLPSMTKAELIAARKEFGEFIDTNVGHRDRTRVDAGTPGLGTFGSSSMDAV